MPQLVKTTTKRRNHLSLRIPQARVLRVLMPDNKSDHYTEWPSYNRVTLASKAGFNPTTGTINRVLNGVPKGSSSGASHPGLIERGMIKVEVFDIDGISETNYRITAAGIKEYERYMATVKRLPARRAKELCVNDRYQ